MIEPLVSSIDAVSPRLLGAYRVLILYATDVTMFVLGSWAASALIAHFNHALNYERVYASAIICATASVATFHTIGLYRTSYAKAWRDEWYYVIAGLAIGFAPLLVLFTIMPQWSSSRLVLVTSFALLALVIGASRCALHGLFAWSADRDILRVALVGRDADLAAMASAPNPQSEFGTRRARALTLIPTPDVEQAMVEAIDPSTESWYATLRHRGCDEILFVGGPTAHTAVMVELASRDRIRVGFAPPGFEAQPVKLDLRPSSSLPVFMAERIPACTFSNRVLKRAFDILVAATGLALAAPIMLVAAAAVALESGRPVLFRQTRVGRDGVRFEMFKFRSMLANVEAASGPVWAVGDPSKDARTTRVGRFLRKTSIDELPQLINVLRGEMSMVGPRPERPVFVEQFRHRYPRYDERHLVRPGITGWAHVHMPRSPGLEMISERLELDLFYVKNYSLFLDVSLIIKTAAEVLFQRWY